MILSLIIWAIVASCIAIYYALLVWFIRKHEDQTTEVLELLDRMAAQELGLKAKLRLTLEDNKDEYYDVVKCNIGKYEYLEEYWGIEYEAHDFN